MSARQAISPATRGASKRSAALISAYREGLGLAAVVVIRKSSGIGIIADEGGGEAGNPPPQAVIVRWWCRRAADAARVAAATTARLHRCRSHDDPRTSSATDLAVWQDDIGAAESPVRKAVAAAAKHLNVALYSDEDVAAEAMRIIARVDDEIERLRRAGDLKTVNRSYRTYRMEASARGEKVAPYADWFAKYRENLVRQLAAALRYS